MQRALPGELVQAGQFDSRGKQGFDTPPRVQRMNIMPMGQSGAKVAASWPAPDGSRMVGRPCALIEASTASISAGWQGVAVEL